MAKSSPTTRTEGHTIGPAQWLPAVASAVSEDRIVLVNAAPGAGVIWASTTVPGAGNAARRMGSPLLGPGPWRFRLCKGDVLYLFNDGTGVTDVGVIHWPARPGE